MSTTTTNKPSPTKLRPGLPPHLLKIAREIRQLILTHAFQGSKITFDFWHLTVESLAAGLRPKVDRSQLSRLLLVCSQIYAEGMSVYRSSTCVEVICIPLGLGLGDVPHFILAGMCQWIQYLAVHATELTNGVPISFPNVQKLRILGTLFCVWDSVQEAEDLAEEHQMRNGLRRKIEARVRPERLDWMQFGLWDVIELVGIYPALRVEAGVEFKVNHIRGGWSVYFYEVDFKTMGMRLMECGFFHHD